jgi:outer membrane protein OmpA-like peptidoglycan-associated protein/tetratricopeptide (TPR) repeat protein
LFHAQTFNRFGNRTQYIALERIYGSLVASFFKRLTKLTQYYQNRSFHRLLNLQIGLHRTMIRTFALLSIFFFFAPYRSLSQTNFTTVKTTSEKAVKAFKEGRDAMQVGDAAAAIRAYRKAVEIDPNFIDAWIYLGGAHRESNHWPEAETAFEKVLALSPSYEVRIYQALATVEWEQDKYTETAEHLKIYLQSDIGNIRDRTTAEKRYNDAVFVAEAIQHPVPFNPELLSDAINTADGDEYFPVQTADGQWLIFTRNTNDDENFYIAKRSDTDKEEWETAQPLEGVNTAENEGAQAISPDGSWIVFTACDRRNDGSQGSCDLYWSQKKGDTWSKAQPFSNVINSPAWESQPTISADGKTIIFASKRDGGLGEADIYETTRQAGGKWSTPRNLGAKINTPFTDCLPFLHPDGQTLYFTSNGHPGFGKDDIFLSRKQPDGTWGKPENLGFPINTKAHDANLVVSLDGKTAYFSSQRTGGKGRIDIYKFDLPAHLRPKVVTYARALVSDAATGYPLVAKVEFTDLATGESYISANTKKDGTFLVCLPAGHRYALNVGRKGYLFHSEYFDLDSTASFLKPYQLEIALRPVKDSTGKTDNKQPIVLKNVFFNTNSADLLPNSRVELDNLVALLNENTTMNIQLNGHTDNVGDDNSNLILSEKRAQSVRDYLVSKGINTTRLRAKGFGENKPITTNDTEEGRAINRRTEFEVWQ